MKLQDVTCVKISWEWSMYQNYYDAITEDISVNWIGARKLLKLLLKVSSKYENNLLEVIIYAD